MQDKKRASFQFQLIELRDRLTKHVDSAEDSLREDVVKPGDTTRLPTHAADADVEGIDCQVAIAQNEESLLEQVQAAMDRIHLGTYGICQDCGREIAGVRLEAIPYTAHCINCARAQVEHVERPVRSQRRRPR